MTEPQPLDSSWPRYSARPFPSSKFVPGKSPHPRHRPAGLADGQIERRPILLSPEKWAQSDDYLNGIDLYNYGFWWECHEVFEELWNIAGQRSEQGNFFQALIQLAAANLKQFMGSPQAAQNLLERGLLRLRRMPTSYMGIDIAELREEIRQRLVRAQFQAPPIRLSPSQPAREGTRTRP